MPTSSLVRWGAIGLMLSGVVWAVLGLSALVGYLQVISGREDVVLFRLFTQRSPEPQLRRLGVLGPTPP